MDEISLKNDNGQILASSRDIAERFGKRHAEIIYAIEGRIDSNGKIKNNGLLMSGISQLSQMFKKSDYVDSSNRKQYEYLMNRDGFSLLVMGFTGKEALQWKLKYIEAFNKMEEEIKSGSYLSEEEKLKLQLFSKNKVEVATAYNRLVEIQINKATKPLLEDISHKEDVIIGLVDDISLAEKRQILNRVVRYNHANYQARWKMLYREFENKYHIDLQHRFERYNEEHKPKCKNKLEYIDRVMSKIPELYEIATKLYENDVKALVEEMYSVAS